MTLTTPRNDSGLPPGAIAHLKFDDSLEDLVFEAIHAAAHEPWQCPGEPRPRLFPPWCLPRGMRDGSMLLDCLHYRDETPECMHFLRHEANTRLEHHLRRLVSRAACDHTNP